mgnify:CR=1 FL=1|jgi:hypothetical protein
MDRKLQQNQEIERLIQAAQSARSFLETEALALQHRLDFPSRIRGSLKTHPTGWLLGSVASGLVASFMLRRKPVVSEKKRRSLPVAVLGLAAAAARPIAKVWITDQLKSFLAEASAQRAVGRTPLSKTPP